MVEAPTSASLVVLISGRGSNLGALLRAVADGSLHARIRCVISNRPDAPGLALARDADRRPDECRRGRAIQPRPPPTFHSAYRPSPGKAQR